MSSKFRVLQLPLKSGRLSRSCIISRPSLIQVMRTCLLPFGVTLWLLGRGYEYRTIPHPEPSATALMSVLDDNQRKAFKEYGNTFRPHLTKTYNLVGPECAPDNTYKLDDGFVQHDSRYSESKIDLGHQYAWAVRIEAPLGTDSIAFRLYRMNSTISCQVESILGS